MFRNRTRWSAAAVWAVLTLSLFLIFDPVNGTAVTRWLITGLVALLPPLVVMGLWEQEQSPSAAESLHVVDRRPS